jgi:RNA polymerase sigma-70 factor (ECF subfamily)
VIRPCQGGYLSHRRGLDGHFNVRLRRENVTDGRRGRARGTVRGSPARLRAVAYQALGSASDADDAVQETWLRLSRADPGTIENLGGWLTRVVARVCLNMLAARRDEPAGVHLLESAATGTDSGPEADALLADSIGPALLVILHTLAPAERISFVLHDIFAVPFDDIAAIVGRSPAAARQLASRARRRVQGIAPGPGTDLVRQRAITGAFLAAARSGNFGALLETLDPDAVVRSDGTEVVRTVDVWCWLRLAPRIGCSAPFSSPGDRRNGTRIAAWWRCQLVSAGRAGRGAAAAGWLGSSARQGR